MKLTVRQENLSKALQRVSRVATTKSSLPILANILLATEGGRLKLAATDLEVGVMTWAGAKIEEEGSVTLPARLFVDFVTNNTDETITLSTEDHEVQLRSDRYQATIQGMDASEFPLIPPPGKDILASIPASLLKHGIQDTLYAAAFDDARPVLNGLCLTWGKQELILAATDSYRLAERRLPLAKLPAKPTPFILPARAAAELVRILPESDEPVALSVSDNQLSLSFPDTHVVTRLVDGTFPDYQQIIPTQASTTATLSRAELIAAVKMASLFARDAAHHIRMTFDPKGRTIAVQAVGSAAGKNTSNVPAAIDGEPVEMAFNAKYILDALNAVHTDELRLHCSGKDRPGVVLPGQEEPYLSLVMPLRLDV